MTDTTTITIAYGDGIGPEIMEATLAILDAGGARLRTEKIDIGESVYKKGIPSGIADSAWDSLRRNRCFLKAPITTPQGGGFKSLNVTIRKTMGMFANVRPCVVYHPFVRALHPKMDMVIVRENEEDLYAGIEHQQTDNVTQSLKLISVTGSERIIRYAFEYARVAGRKKVTCISKDNIMKITDGLFHKTFDRIAKEYPGIAADHMIVDIGAARIASRPENFDVIVTENLYGDIISDIAAEVSGSVGLGGSSNIGKAGAMFEAIHGSAPDIAGKGVANPSGLLHGALMMLQHIGQGGPAEKIHNAWLKTIEDGIHTGDIFTEGISRKKVGTKDFTSAVIERLGARPEKLAPVSYGGDATRQRVEIPPIPLPVAQDKKLVGVDVFVHWRFDGSVKELVAKIHQMETNQLTLKSIDSRGLLLWPESVAENEMNDHCRCRFMAANDAEAIKHAQIVELLKKLDASGLDFVKTENLYTFGGVKGFSVAQGQ